MITMLGSPRRCCDGLTRRETLKAGALSLLGGGFNLPNLLARRRADAAPARGPARPRASSCSTCSAARPRRTCGTSSRTPPPSVRGEFKPDRHQRARHPDLRAPAAHGPVDAPGRPRPLGQPQGRLPQLPASYTGYEVPLPDQHPRDTDPPSMGSVCEYLNQRPRRPARLRLHAVLARLGPGVPPRPAPTPASSASATTR